METTKKIQKVVTKCKVGTQKSDFAFWQTQSYQARIDALDKTWKYGTEGFQNDTVHIINLQNLKQNKKATYSGLIEFNVKGTSWDARAMQKSG